MVKKVETMLCPTESAETWAKLIFWRQKSHEPMEKLETNSNYSRTYHERPSKEKDNSGLSFGLVSPQGIKTIEKWGEIKYWPLTGCILSSEVVSLSLY